MPVLDVGEPKLQFLLEKLRVSATVSNSEGEKLNPKIFHSWIEVQGWWFMEYILCMWFGLLVGVYTKQGRPWKSWVYMAMCRFLLRASSCGGGKQEEMFHALSSPMVCAKWCGRPGRSEWGRHWTAALLTESITCYLVISSGWAGRWWLPQNTWKSSVFLFHKELRAVPLQMTTRLPWTDCRIWSPCQCLLRMLRFCFKSLACTGACKMSLWVSAAVEPYQGDSFYSFFCLSLKIQGF